MTRFRAALGALLASCCILVHAATPIDPAIQATVVEFYNQSLDHYFITTDVKEIADLDGGVHAGWARTGLSFQAIKAGSTFEGSIGVCRFYGRPEAHLDSHFYSGTLAECATLKASFADSWLLESEEVFRGIPVDSMTGNCVSGSGPIYRLWNNRSDVNHRYTDQIEIADQMKAKGYIPEGNGSPSRPVIFCMPTKAGAAPASTNGTPNCALYANDTAPLAGATVTLTAACSDTPASYTWTGCSAAATSTTCTTTSAYPGTVTYSVAGTNAKGKGTAAKLDVAWASSGGPVPFCSLTASSTSPTANGTITLSGSCSQGPTRYDWLACSYYSQNLCNIISTCSATGTSCTVTQVSAGYAHYALRAANGAGVGLPAGVDVYWNQAGGGGGGGGTTSQPVCTITADKSSPPVGSTVTFTASCTNSPQSYGWTGCTGLSTTCTATSATPGSKSYQLSASNSAGNGPPASITVSWVQAGPPTCTLASSQSAPLLNTTITLTATCSGATGNYVWTGCTSTTATCQTTSANAGAVTYSMTVDNSQGTSVPATKQVTWTTPPPPPTVVPTCSVSASNASPFVGQAITLTANCDQQTQSYVWTGCSPATNPSQCSASATVVGNATYTVKGHNVVGDSAVASTVVNWLQSTAPTDFCPNYAASGSKIINGTGPPWHLAGYTYPSDYGGNFPDKAIVVLPVTVPGSPTSYANSVFQAAALEYQSTATMRWVSLSRSRCDFRAVDPANITGPASMTDDSYGYLPSQGVAARVGSNEVMKPGETWYINVYNHSGRYPTCKSGCNFAVTYLWPN